MEQITSGENRFVKEYGRLAARKSARDEEERFVLEGIKLIREAITFGFPVDAVLVTEECLRRCGKELSALEGKIRLLQITEPLSSKLAQTKSPQGIYAICRKLDKPLETDTIYSGGRYIFLSRLQDTGNVGTIIRTAESLGIDGVILSENMCDIYHPKVIRASMGSVLRMPFCFAEDEPALLRDFAANGVHTYAAVLAEDAVLLPDVRFADPAVLLIGNEGNGLAAEVSAACTDRIMIPMRGRAESLNASMAAGILMWEMTK